MGLASAERRRSFSGLVRRSFCMGSHWMPEKAWVTGEGGMLDMVLCSRRGVWVTLTSFSGVEVVVGDRVRNMRCENPTRQL